MPNTERARLIQIVPTSGWGTDLTARPDRRCYQVRLRVIPNDHPQANDPNSLNYTGLSAQSDRHAIRLAHDQMQDRDLENIDTLIVLERDRNDAAKTGERPRFARVQEAIPLTTETLLWVKWLRPSEEKADGETAAEEPAPTDQTPTQATDDDPADEAV